jgi:hypothetical protein
MRDLGAFAILATAPILGRVLKLDDESEEESRAGIRRFGLFRPEDEDDLPMLNMLRAFAWMTLMIGLLVFIAGASLAREASSPGVDKVLEVAMDVVTVPWLITMGMAATSTIRFSLSHAFRRRLRARFRAHPERPRLGVAGLLTVPTSFDLGFAVVFFACFAPEVYA